MVVLSLTNEIPEESGQFRFLRTASLTNINGSVGLILSKASIRGFYSRVLSAFPTPHSFDVSRTSFFFILIFWGGKDGVPPSGTHGRQKPQRF